MGNVPGEDKKLFRILVWRFGDSARRKYVRSYSAAARDVFSACNVRWVVKDR